MKRKSSFIADLLLSLGIVILVSLSILYILRDTSKHALLLSLLPVFSGISGIPVAVIGFKFTKKLHHIFIGLELVFWSLATVFLARGMIPYEFARWWPVIGISGGIFLFVAGYISFRKIRFRYFIPAITLFLMGIWFALFSFNIIKVPFHIVALVGGPLFFIMAGMFLIIFFMLQKKYDNLVVKDDEQTEFDAEYNIENEKSE